MAKSDRPLQIDIPRPADERPAWSRVGIVAAVGFTVGILWPKFAGVRVGPAVPGEGHPIADASAAARAAASPASATPSASPSATPSATADNLELVTVGASKTLKCFDKKDKKVEECDKLGFDAIAAKKLKELASCPSALGLEGTVTIGFDLRFDKKEVQVVKQKKGNTLPASTVAGILQCAAKEFSSVSLEDIAHKHRRYTLQVPLTFYPPGKHPESAAEGDGDEDKAAKDAPADGKAETAAGAATVSWDTALLRKEPKDGDVVARLVRGTHVKILEKKADWYKVESNGKAGWIYRGAVGL